MFVAKIITPLHFFLKMNSIVEIVLINNKHILKTPLKFLNDFSVKKQLGP